MNAWDRFWFAVTLCVALATVLESIRRRPAHRLPWWITHGPGLAWAGVVLIPWFIALRRGYWPVPAGPGDTVPLKLPVTYGYTLLALIGLTAGIAPFAFSGRHDKMSAPISPAKIRPTRAFIVITSLCITYFISCGFSPSKVWVLSSHSSVDTYSDSADSSFLTLSILVLAVLAIAYIARQQPPSRAGIFLYLSIVILVFGSAHRYLVMILVLAYLIKVNPFKAIHGVSGRRLVSLVMVAGAIWLVAFSGLGKLSALRSGASVPASYIYTSTLSSFDVMGSAEYLMEAGGKPGPLHGSSYLALPSELVPHVLLGSRARPPAAAAQSAIFGNTGASAPLWEEGVLNFGAYGDVISMMLIGALWGAAFRWATLSQRRLAITASAIGPVWILFLYQILSRILVLAAVDLFGSMVVALLLWNWIQASAGQTPAVQSGVPTRAKVRSPTANRVQPQVSPLASGG